MAAASPRKPRRAKGRHRKNSGSGCVRWLQAGAVGFGLAAAIAGGQGVASAATDDSSSSSDSSSSADGSSSDDGGGPTATSGADDAPPQRAKHRAEAPSSQQDDADAEADGDDEDVVDDASDGESDDAQEPTTADPVESSEADLEAESSVESTATVDDTETPITETESTEVIRPVALAAAAAPSAAATATPNELLFQSVLQRAISRLAAWPGTPIGAWPGTPRNFVTITNRQTDQSLDAANNQLDNVTATASLFSPARWLPDLIGIIGTFFVSLPPSSTTTDRFNAMGDFLNRVVPPFKLADGAGTLDIISPYKIMGAAVVGTATVLQDMLNGIYDPQQWAIHVIKATTGANATVSDLSNFSSLSAKVVAAQAAALLGGDGGAFDEPERAWNVTFPTWTEAQTNPFTIVTYIAFVGIYKRFQEMAALQTYSTTTTYDSWHYKNALGLYAAGTFHVLDQDGNPVKFFGVSQGGTFSSATNALVTINNDTGGFTYTPPAVWDPHFHDAAFFHRSTSENEADRYDTVQVPVLSADGAPYTLTFRIEIIGGTNANPTGSNAVTGTDAAGVVKGKVTGADSDGDTLKYSLVGSSVNGLSGNSAYTKNGANNGGIVTINPTTGEYTYVSTSTVSGTQSFQVNINDGHHGNTVITVTVPNTTSITPTNVTKPADNIVTGSVPGSTNQPGVFTSYSLGTAPGKGSVTSFNPANGAFTYTRNSGLGHSTTADDVVTIIATDANGRQVTLRMTVQPTVPNTSPTVVVTTTPTVGTLNGTTQTSTGKLTYADADGDAPIWTTATSARGGTITFAADGTFTYTSNLTVAQRHAVARIGAAGSTFNGVALAAWEDAFTATVSDGFGGTAQVTVKVPIYAINANPTISTNNPACGFGTCTATATTTDPDGDDLSGGLNSSNNGTGSPWYTLSRGSVTINAGNQHTFSWTGNSNGAGTQQTGIQIYTVYDGYYRVTNGIVDSTYFSRAWVQWNNTTRTFGN
ncbi:Ig-like domain-containing protein [Mycobacterium sp. 236(2023)]|uniref:Ig-like domain-containing protein n=1 Tax=Mycobacterium sp. 236(2023) TaxID=3038163 RepID=UPI0024154AF7|nr:Ig-like domain-containing protein [Mycobacterium sp. 236(2023)]MDG4669060.1 Ig-like domain-containing protein [Mycobacterium sp. 236(2023)]